MIIRLAFMVNREAFKIEIKDKEVWYSDRKWDRAIRLIPKDKDFLKKIVLSRNKIPSTIKEIFNLTKKEQEEYDNAKDDRELADICIRDCKLKGALHLKEEIISEPTDADAPTIEPTKEQQEDGNI